MSRKMMRGLYLATLVLLAMISFTLLETTEFRAMDEGMALFAVMMIFAVLGAVLSVILWLRCIKNDVYRSVFRNGGIGFVALVGVLTVVYFL